MGKMNICVLIGLLVSLTLFPFLFRLDFAKSSFGTLDVLPMTSPYALPYLMMICVLLSTHVILSKRFGFAHLLICTYLVYGFFILSQYPQPLQIDFFVHSAGSREISESGTLNVEHGYAKSWPSAFVLWSILSEVLSIDVLNLNWLLVLLTMIMTTVMLYLIGKRTVGHRWAGLPGALYLVSNAFYFQGMQRDRFSPLNLAYILYLSLFYVLLLSVEHKKSSIMLMIFTLMFAISSSHLFSSMLVFFIILGMWLLRKLNSSNYRIATSLLFVALIMWITWWMNNSSSTFERAIRMLFSTPLPQSKVGALSLPTFDATAQLGKILRDYYVKLVLAAVGFTSIIGLWQNRRNTKTKMYGGAILGGLLGSSIALMAPKTETDIQWSVILLLLIVPIAFGASLVFIRSEKRCRLVSLLVIVMIVPTFLAMLAYEPLYVSAVHSWETQSFLFLSRYNGVPVKIEGDKYTVRPYAIYYDLKNLTTVSELSFESINYTERLEENPTFFRGDIIIRSFKQELYSNDFIVTQDERRLFWNQVDANINRDLSYNKIYDNRYMVINRKRPEIP